jgi:phage gp36-like protein
VAQYASSAQFAVYGLPAAALDGFTGSVDDHLVAASALFDSYARGRYRVPLTLPAPIEVAIAVCVLAAYSILNTRGYDPHSGSDSNVRTRYEDLMGRQGQHGWLQQLSEGKVNLDIAADATAGVHDGGPIVSSRWARGTGSGCYGQYRDSECDTRGGRYNFWGNRTCW